MQYAVTFGQKYNREPHPVNEQIDANAFVVIEAEDEEHAQIVSYEIFNQAWAFVYPYDREFEQQIEDFSLHEVEL